DDTFVIALNRGAAPARIDFAAGSDLPEGAVLQDVWSSATVRVAGGNITGGQIPARDGVVWQLVPRTHEVPGA
ncbi:MAG TPA: hypothetical protein VEZ12_02785, partial [Herpetosiphonaceae bacterium]|nr:hypothetical protein [Herpetosiphonaceae bacterium]